jgi:hypothetical protein
MTQTPIAAYVDRPAEGVMEMLRDRVPLTLLLDLGTPGDPGSQEILDAEGVPEFAWWEPRS